MYTATDTSDERGTYSLGHVEAEQHRERWNDDEAAPDAE